MESKKSSTVVGVFHDAARAQEAVRALKGAGFRDDQIGVVSHDSSGGTTTTGTAEKGSHVAAGAATGVAAGAGVGALWALGIAANVLPGIGPVISGGILASALASAAGGAAIAGIAGALIGLGLPEEEAHYYEGEFKSGRTIVTVKADGRYDEAWRILHSHDAYNREFAASAPRQATAATRTGGGQTVTVHEEQLHAHKTPVKVGEVKVRKEVVSDQQTIQVPVTREEIVIERHPVSGSASSQSIRAGEEIRIPVSEEQVRVSKDTVVKEEVSVGKRKVTDTEQVSGTVRREEVKVTTDGTVNVRGDADRKAHK